MSVTPSSYIVGVFTDRTVAEQAIEALYNAGFAQEHIRYSATETSGGFFDGLKNLFTSSSASADNLANDLNGMGLSNDAVQYYSNEYTSGHTILAVNAAGREREALSILHQFGAYGTSGDSQPTDANTDSVQQPADYTQADDDDITLRRPQAIATDEQPSNNNFSDQQSPVANSDLLAEDQATETTAPDYYAEAQTPQDSALTPEQAATDQVPQADVVGSDYSADGQAVPADVSAPEQEVTDQATPLEVATPDSGSTDDSDDQDNQLEGAEAEYVTVDQVTASEVTTPEQETEEDQVGSATPEQVTASEVTTPEQETEEDQVSSATPEYASSEQSEQPLSSVSPTETYDSVTTSENEATGQTTPVDETPTPTSSVDVNTVEPQTEVQLPQTDPAIPAYSNKLSWLQQKLQTSQQQLQEARAQLQSAKEHETQLQAARQQLQEIEAELQKTQAELQETHSRIEQY